MYCARRHQPQQFGRLGATVDDAQHPFLGGQFGGDIRPGAPLLRQRWQRDVDPRQLPVQPRRIGGQFPGVAEAGEAYTAEGVEARRGQRRLGGGGEHQADPVTVDQLAQCVQHRTELGGRQQLGFVEDDDALGNVMQLAAARGACGVERLEELDVGGDDDRRLPVLGR